MPVATKANITQDDVIAVASVEGLAKLFRRLGYNVDPLPEEPGAYGLIGDLGIQQMVRMASLGGRLFVFLIRLDELAAARTGKNLNAAPLWLRWGEWTQSIS